LSRGELAEEFGLDAGKRWVFVPENYRWAFFTDNKLRKLGKRGVEVSDLFAMRDFCRASLTELVQWSDALARSGRAEVIFRPRPATSVEEVSAFFDQVLPSGSRAFHLIKGRTARDWVLASEVVASSYSTVLIEAAIAGKLIIKVDPLPIPPSLHYEWCDLVPGAVNAQEFVTSASNERPGRDSALRRWAETVFRLGDDPISRLVEVVAVEVAACEQTPRTASDHAMKMDAGLAARAAALDPIERHTLFESELQDYFFNPGTHEKDLFGRDDIDERVRAWHAIIEEGPVSANVSAAI
jgi:hypothetical protein